MLWVAEGGETGRRTLVVGAARQGLRVVLIDESSGTGRSMAAAAEALRKSGCVVKDALVLVDRLEGAKGRLAAAGVTLHAFADVRELVQGLYEGKRITKAEWQAAVKQLEG